MTCGCIRGERGKGGLLACKLSFFGVLSIYFSQSGKEKDVRFVASRNFLGIKGLLLSEGERGIFSLRASCCTPFFSSLPLPLRWAVLKNLKKLFYSPPPPPSSGEARQKIVDVSQVLRRQLSSSSSSSSSSSPPFRDADGFLPFNVWN